MVACLGEHGLELDAEQILRILSVEERSKGGDAVGTITQGIIVHRLDAEHIDTRTHDQPTGLIVGTQVNLRGVAILDITRALSLRAVGAVLHLPQGGTGEGNLIRKFIIRLCKRSTAEGAERSTGIQ